MIKVLNMALSISLVMVLTIIVFTVGPWLETRFFPAYSKFTIVDARPTETGTIVNFRYTKFRNCDPQGYAWYLGDSATGFKQLNSRNRGQTFVPRPLGTQQGTPIEIEGITPAEIPYIFAEIYSHCHPFWTTRSVVHP